MEQLGAHSKAVPGHKLWRGAGAQGVAAPAAACSDCVCDQLEARAAEGSNDYQLAFYYGRH